MCSKGGTEVMDSFWQRGERGFSLLLVLLAIVVVTIVGISTLYVASKDGVAAEARERAGLARVAAETGMRHLMRGFQPTLVDDQRDLGEDGGGASGAYADVLAGAAPMVGPVPIPAPPGLTASYVAWGGASTLGGTQVIVEGRIHAGDRIVARSRISGFITMVTGSNRYGQYGATSGNTGEEDFGGVAPSYGGL